MEKKISFLKKPAVQTLIASLLCILLGLLVGFIVLLIINPSGAWKVTDLIGQHLAEAVPGTRCPRS